MKQVKFTIYGEPYGKVNMRPVRMGGHLSLISPNANKSYLYNVRLSYVDKYKDLRFDDDAELIVLITAYKSIPKSTSKKKQVLMLENKLRPITKPDCDNISKAVCDGLNGLAFRDDSQIVELHVAKRYSHQPRVEVKIIERGE